MMKIHLQVIISVYRLAVGVDLLLLSDLVRDNSAGDENFRRAMKKVAEIEEAEKQKMKRKVDKILAYNPDVFINRQLIYNYPEQLLAEKGIMVIEHADFDGTERLAAVLGADILSTFDNPETGRLGTCALIEEIMIGEDKVIKFSGTKANEACSIVLRGSGSHILDE